MAFSGSAAYLGATLAHLGAMLAHHLGAMLGIASWAEFDFLACDGSYGWKAQLEQQHTFPASLQVGQSERRDMQFPVAIRRKMYCRAHLS